MRRHACVYNAIEEEKNKKIKRKECVHPLTHTYTHTHKFSTIKEPKCIRQVCKSTAASFCIHTTFAGAEKKVIGDAQRAAFTAK